MTKINICQLAFVYLMFAQTGTNRIYTRRIFKTFSSSGGVRRHGNPTVSKSHSYRQNIPFNRFISGRNGDTSIPKEILANLPPGASVSISTKINVGQPGQSVSTIRTHLPTRTRVSGPIVETRFNKTILPNSRRWKPFVKTWHKTVPVSTVSKEKQHKPKWMTWSTNVQNINTTNEFGVNNAQSLIPKKLLANLPPGAHVKFSSSSSFIPQSGITIQSTHPGHIRKVTRTFTSSPTSHSRPRHHDGLSIKDRNLPQPKPSLRPGIYCDETLCEDEKIILLDDHNRVRRSTTPPASNMNKIIWDVELEKSAQAYAKMCIWTHDKSRSNNAPYRYVGQNMHARRGARTIMSATKRWEREQDNYNINTGMCTPGKLCGHYTQMVWADTETVGCAMWKCPYIHRLGWRNAYLVVCNYGPGGNIGGEKPYKIGTKCNDCCENHPTCIDGLCA